MLPNVPGTLYMILLSNMTILQGQYYYCYFTDEETGSRKLNNLPTFTQLFRYADSKYPDVFSYTWLLVS